MRNLPVDWSEGMFLRPHHFQAADRYWTEALQTSEPFDHQYNYGLRRVEISQEALLNSQFKVHELEARLRDGTIVTLGSGAEPDRVDLRGEMDRLSDAVSNVSADLKDSFQVAPTVRVYLAVPRLKMGAANVADESTETPHRYNRETRASQDEGSGGNDQELGLKSLSARILLSTENRVGYECLEIAEIQRAGDQDATPRLNPKYIPPLLSVDAWPELQRNIVQAILDIVGAYVERFSEVIKGRGITLVSEDPRDLDRLWMLSQLNECYAVLSVLAFASGVHPYDAYAELCRLVGKLAIFGDARRVPTIPQYDHDDLGGIFHWVKQQVQESLRHVPEDEYQRRPFIGAGLGMHVTLDPIWLNPDWQWFVGVALGEASEQDCREALSAGQLDWKLGSAQHVEIIFQQGRQGLNLVACPRTPRALPSKGWVYYEVNRDNEAWKEVQRTQTLAMRLKDKLILNRQNLQGERRLIVNYKGRSIALEFALFAVRVR